MYFGVYYQEQEQKDKYSEQRKTDEKIQVFVFEWKTD